MDVLNRQALQAAPQASWAFVALAQAQAVAGKRRRLDPGAGTRRPPGQQRAGCVGTDPPPPAQRSACGPAGPSGRARDLLGELTERMSRFTEGTAALSAKVEAVRHLIRNQTPERLLDEP